MSGLAALKYFGGKQNLADKIIALMPPHKFYVEPFCGALGVLLNKNGDGIGEVVNDINSNIWNFFSVLQNDKLFTQFKRIIDFCPFSEEEFNRARDYFKTYKQGYSTNVYAAAKFFIYNRLSMGGQMKDFTPLTVSRLRGNRQADVNAFLNCIDDLPEICKRLKNVAILNRRAIDVIEQYDQKDALIYCDPPYLSSTRTSKKVYEYEMRDYEHSSILHFLKDCESKIMISGYPSKLYNNALKDWNRVDIKVANSASHKKVKDVKTECIWKNF